MMRPFIAALAAVGLLATPALAQKGMRGGKRGDAATQKTEDQKKAEKKLEADYKAALDSIPNQKFDPWGSVRSTPQAK
jgi:hypothetical protein